jgi:protein TonB
MENKTLDWKFVADSFFDKSVSLAVLMVLFAFLVSPNIEVKPYQAKQKIQVQALDIPPEIKEKIQPPPEAAKPVVDIIIDDDMSSDDDEDIQVIDTITSTSLDPYKEVAPPPTIGKTPKFVNYDKAPVAIKVITPKYPKYARQMAIQGQVILNVEVLKSGKVGAVEIIKSLEPGLDNEAVKAIKKWTFEPAKSNGKPVSVWLTYPIDFSLE